MREDKPLVSPSLLELSACVVAQNESISLFQKQYLIDEECSAKVPAAVQLPINCVENVLKCVCNELRQKQQTSLCKSENDKLAETATKMLSPFFKTYHYPVSKLDLSGIYLTDQILANLLITQQKTLTYLNLSFVKGITSSGVCSLLFESNAKLFKLKSLKLTSANLLRVPKLRRSNNSRYNYQNNSQFYIGGLASLPVVSEYDLNESSISSNSSGRNNALITYQKSNGFFSNDGFPYYSETVPHFMTFFPSISHLYLIQENSFNIEDEQQGIFLVRVLEGVKENLQTLDLSEWQNFHQFLNGITVLTKLTTLVLYDVHYLENSIGIIKEIKTITSLDLSQSERITGNYTRPVTALHSLVTSLTNLKFLDISGTNLISPCSDDDRPFRGTGLIASDIPGLSYLKKPLKYLGIFSCNNASHFQNIPAEKICGDHGENQILLALEVYMERPKMMQAVLNESYQLYRFGINLSRHVEALHLVLRALALHKLNSSLQIAGSASMFYIIRKVHMNRNTKRSVISALVNGMENHREEQVMVRNCCLSLCQFEIPHEIMFNYGRVASLLVKVLETHNSDQLTQRIVVFLLNSMACHVEGDQKIEVGNIGAIEVILEQIRRKHSLETCDDVMEVGWSFLWNITDETPTNCNRFLNAKGLELFQMCYSQFSNETELVRNMMGLIGNIAEVKTLRYQLMNVNYIKVFVRLLTHLSDGIEISYNSAGVLAHLVSDGDEVWLKYVGPSLSRANATKSWNLTARRYINYRSFKPILKLLPMYDSSGSQHWAAWALANLTLTDMNKYCRYVQDEGGESLLNDLVTDQRTPTYVRKLGMLVLKNISKWRENIKNNNNNNNNGVQNNPEANVHLDLID